jgi:hypothetical protein
MTSLAITFSDPVFVRANVHDGFDLVLGVEATLEVRVGDRTICAESMNGLTDAKGRTL